MGVTGGTLSVIFNNALASQFVPTLTATSPTGGAANGIPLNVRIDGSFPGTPEASPPSTFTGCLIAAAREAAVKITRVTICRNVGISCSQRVGLQSVLRYRFLTVAARLAA